jgi:hypothetical protein
MASIFHYTDASGLLGILSSTLLFASDYRFLNDTSELGIIRDLVVPVFEAEIGEILPKLVQAGFLHGFYEFHGMRGDRSQAEVSFKALLGVVNEVSPLFVISFCRHEKDSAEYIHGLLSQWRGYGRSGGFAIEFDEGGIVELAEEDCKKCAYAGYKADDVIYEEYNKLFWPDDYKGIAGEIIRRTFEPNPAISAITGCANFDAFVPRFMNTAPFMKHWGFREEKEYRVLFSCLRKDKIPQADKREPKEICFRSSRGQIIPYIKVFQHDKGLPIKSIVVGPHAFQELQYEAVKLLLRQKRIDAQIRLSGIPYRE